MTSTTLHDSTTIAADPNASRGSGGVATLAAPTDLLTSGELLSAPASEWLSQFDSIYREAEGDPGRIPWAHRGACPWLTSWLNVEAPGLIRPGARVCVVGCGLGEDAVALAERGYEVTAFDACASAIEWAQRLHADAPIRFLEANLFDLPSKLLRRFDLVVEVNTLQSLPPSNRHALARGMSELLNHVGILVAVCRGRAACIRLDELVHPPFGFLPDELIGVMAGAGLTPVKPGLGLDDFFDDSTPPVRRLRGAFRRG